MSNYYLALNQQKAGPFTIDQVRDHLKDGSATPKTLFWQEGQTDWQPLENLAGQLDLPTASTPPADTPSAPVSVSAPASRSEPLTEAVPPPAPAPVAPSIIAPPPAFPPVITSGAVPAPVGGSGGRVPGYVPAGQRLSQPTQTSGAAITSLVFGILAIPGLFFPFFGLVPPLVAIVCGHIGLSGIKRSNGQLAGSGLGTAGLILGYLTLLLALIFTVVLVVGIGYMAKHPELLNTPTPTPTPADTMVPTATP